MNDAERSESSNQEEIVYAGTPRKDRFAAFIPEILRKNELARKKREAQKPGQSAPHEASAYTEIQNIGKQGSLETRLLTLYRLSQEYIMTPANMRTLDRSNMIGSLAKLEDSGDEDFLKSLEEVISPINKSTKQDTASTGQDDEKALLNRANQERRANIRSSILGLMADNELREYYERELNSEKQAIKSEASRTKLREILHLRALRSQIKTQQRVLRVEEFLAKESSGSNRVPKNPGETPAALQKLEKGLQIASVKEKTLTDGLSYRERGLLAAQTLLDKKYELDTTGFAMTPTREDVIGEIVELTAQGFRIFLGGPTGTGKTATALFALKEMTKGNYTVITWTGETGIRDLWGGPQVKITEKGPKSEMSEGPVMQAHTGRVQGILHEEMTEGQVSPMISMKTIWSAKPGDTIHLPMWNGVSFTKEQVIELATGNLKGKRHQEREEMDPAVAREWKAIELPFMPADEARDNLILPMLIDRSGLVMLSKNEVDMVTQFCKAAELSQRAYLEEIPDEVKSSDLYQIIAPAGGDVNLTKVFLDTGTVKDLFSGWESSGKTLEEYLRSGLKRFVDQNPHFKEMEGERETMKKILKAYGFDLDKSKAGEFFSSGKLGDSSKGYLKPSELGFLIPGPPPSDEDDFGGQSGEPEDNQGSKPQAPTPAAATESQEEMKISEIGEMRDFIVDLEEEALKLRGKNSQGEDNPTLSEIIESDEFKSNVKEKLIEWAKEAKNGSSGTIGSAILLIDSAVQARLINNAELEDVSNILSDDADGKLKDGFIRNIKKNLSAITVGSYTAWDILPIINAGLRLKYLSQDEVNNFFDEINLKPGQNNENLINALLDDINSGLTLDTISRTGAAIQLGVLNDEEIQKLFERIKAKKDTFKTNYLIPYKDDLKGDPINKNNIPRVIRSLGQLAGLREYFEERERAQMTPAEFFGKLAEDVLSLDTKSGTDSELITLEELIRDERFREKTKACILNEVRIGKSSGKNGRLAVLTLNAAKNLNILTQEDIAEINDAINIDNGKFKQFLKAEYLAQVRADNIDFLTTRDLVTGVDAAIDTSTLDLEVAEQILDTFRAEDRIFTENMVSIAAQGQRDSLSARDTINLLYSSLKRSVMSEEAALNISKIINMAGGEFENMFTRYIKDKSSSWSMGNDNMRQLITSLNALSGLREYFEERERAQKSPAEFVSNLENKILSQKSQKEDENKGKTVAEIIKSDFYITAFLNILDNTVESNKERLSGFSVLTRLLNSALNLEVVDMDTVKKIIAGIQEYSGGNQFQDIFKLTVITELSDSAQREKRQANMQVETILGLDAALQTGVINANEAKGILNIIKEDNSVFIENIGNYLLDAARNKKIDGFEASYIINIFNSALRLGLIQSKKADEIMKIFQDNDLFTQRLNNYVLNMAEQISSDGLSITDLAQLLTSISGLREYFEGREFERMPPGEYFGKLKNNLMETQFEQEGIYKGKKVKEIIQDSNYQTIFFSRLDALAQKEEITELDIGDLVIGLNSAIDIGVIEKGAGFYFLGSISNDEFGIRTKLEKYLSRITRQSNNFGEYAAEAVQVFNAVQKLGIKLSNEEELKRIINNPNGIFSEKLGDYLEKESNTGKTSIPAARNTVITLNAALVQKVLKLEDITKIMDNIYGQGGNGSLYKKSFGSNFINIPAVDLLEGGNQDIVINTLAAMAGIADYYSQDGKKAKNRGR